MKAFSFGGLALICFLLSIVINLIITAAIIWAIASLAVSTVKAVNGQCNQVFVMEKELMVQGTWFCEAK